MIILGISNNLLLSPIIIVITGKHWQESTLSFVLLVCSWHHDGHVGWQEQIWKYFPWVKCRFYKITNMSGGGGRGNSSKYYSGRLYPKVQLLTLLYTILDRKGTPFINLLLTLNCFKCTVIKIWINHKTRRFSQLFHRHNIHVSALLGQFTNQNTPPYPYLCI